MRRLVLVLSATAVAAGLTLSAAPAGAQAGNLAEFCSARLQLNSAFGEGKAATQTALDRLASSAPAAIAPAATAIRDAYKAKGEKGFDKVEDQIAAADKYVYDSCPGAKLDIRAIDYGYEGVPTTVKAGPTNIKLTNAAPKEEHEIGLARLLPAGEAMDVQKLLKLPEKKLGKYLDISSATGTFAPPGEAGYTLVDLKPGKYVYACFIPVGGKKNGKPHFVEGMYGTFTVQ